MKKERKKKLVILAIIAILLAILAVLLQLYGSEYVPSSNNYEEGDKISDSQGEIKITVNPPEIEDKGLQGDT